MSDDEGETFETADAGSSHVYPQQAGELRKGSFVMIKGHPCKVAEISMSKTGKHGHAKAHIVALDIFTAKKYEDLCPASHNMSVPYVKKEEYQVLTADRDTGAVSLLIPTTGATKDDLNLPDVGGAGDPTDEDKKLAKEICEACDTGEKTVLAIVQGACGMEKIIGVKLTDN